jgi:exonuclease III
LEENLVNAKILDDIYHSDHCPILVRLKF